jgi:hypothetical protein
VTDRVLAPPAVLDGIEALRRAGATNILDRPRVVELANELGLHAAVLWIHENPGLYARGVFAGFQAAGDPDA